MRILYLTTSKWINFGAYFDTCQKYGHEVHLIGGKGDYRYKEKIYLHDASLADKIIYKTLMKFSLCDDFALNRKILKNTIKKIRPDIIHALGVDYWGILAASFGLNIPVVLSTLGGDVLEVPFERKDMFERVKRALNKADIIQTTPSSSLVDQLRKDFHVEKEKIVPLSPGIEYKRIEAIISRTNKAEVKKRYGIDENEFVIFAPRGMRSVLEPVFALIPVAKKMESLDMEFKIIVKLHGSNQKMRRRFINQVEGNKLQKKFILIRDFIDYDEVIKLFVISDVFLSLAKRDQIAFAVLEGLATETIPVLSKIETYIERFKEPQNCFFVDNYDPEELLEKVEYLYNNHTQIQNRIAQNNAQLVRELYDREKNIDKINDIYLMLK
jgi:glycosyltransferase involved in cell wall biosynthesis